MICGIHFFIFIFLFQEYFTFFNWYGTIPKSYISLFFFFIILHAVR